MVSVYVINLWQDVEKLATISAALNQYDFVRQTRIDAAAGSTLPVQLCIKITGGDVNAVNAKGALGCMLSHMRAWEIFLSGQEEWIVVVEDDAALRDWSGLPALRFPENFDIIFANHRTENLDPQMRGSMFTRIDQSLRAIEARNQSVGTDCYIISRAGAEKLLVALKTDGYAGHLDFRILAYAVAVEAAAQVLEEGFVLKNLRNHYNVGKQPVFLNHFVLSPSLTEHRVLGETSRTREDRIGAWHHR